MASAATESIHPLLPLILLFIDCKLSRKANSKRGRGKDFTSSANTQSQQGPDVVTYPHAPYNAGASQPKRGRVQFSEYHHSSSLNYNHAIIALANTPAFNNGASWQDCQQCSFLRLPQVLPDLRPGLDATSPAGLNAGSAKPQPSSTAA